MVRIVAIGDNDADCYLSEGRMFPGGNCLNVAVHARRFGAEAAFVGAVADDAPGRLIRTALQAEGVDISHLRTEPGLTAYCVIGHRDGDRIFVSYDLGVSRFVPFATDIAFAANFDAAHVGQSSGLDPWIGDIATVTRLSYDFATRRDADHRRAIAPKCWLASISAGDLPQPDAAALGWQMHREGAARVLVTRGAKGAMLIVDGLLHEVTARQIRPVDTLGAGDTFIAATLVGLLRGDPAPHVLGAATAAATETCMFTGAIGHGVPIDLPVPLPALQSGA